MQDAHRQPLHDTELPQLASSAAEARVPNGGEDFAVAQPGSRTCLGRCGILRDWGEEVQLSLVSQYFNITFTSVMLGALFDAYLQIKGGSNAFVGTIESVRGIAALVLALPLGWAGDRWPKTSVLRWNLAFGGLAAASLVIGLPFDAVPLLVFGCVVYSIHNQCLFSLLPPSLAESTTAGDQRTRAMSHLATTSSLGNASGPLLQLLLLCVLQRSTWSTSELHLVLGMGFIFYLLYAPLLWRAQRLIVSKTAAESEAPAGGSFASGPGSLTPAASAICEDPRWRWIIASLCEASAVLTAIGSGMTFKYWPLFFKGDFHFSPAGVCAMQLSIWVAIAGSAQLAAPLAKRFGRLPTAVLLHVSGTALLFVISIRSLGVFLEVPLVLVRNALMNSGGPLTQALILDLVPKQHRGKWSSIASLRRMTWSGSAFIGGALSDSHDYRFAFFITACVHSVAGLTLILTAFLWWLRTGEARSPRSPRSAM